MSTVEIVSDSENKLLARHEVDCVFRGGNGLITRQGAAEAIASKLGTSKDNVQVISLRGKFGVRDLSGKAYVFSDSSLAKTQLPEYLFTRQLSKDERKKAKEEKKKAKSAPPATAEKKA